MAVSPITPPNYHEDQPYAIEGQLAGLIGSNDHPLAMPMLLNYYNQRQQAQGSYHDYMQGVNQLQAQNSRNQLAEGLIDKLGGGLKSAHESGPAGAGVYLNTVGGQLGLQPGDIGRFMNDAGRAQGSVDFEKNSKGIADLSSAGITPVAGQPVTLPGGIPAGTTGYDSRVLSAIAGAGGHNQGTVTSTFSGNSGTANQRVVAQPLSQGVMPQPMQAGGAPGPTRADQPLPSAPAPDAATSSTPAAAQAPTGKPQAEPSKADIMAKVQLLKYSSPKQAQDIIDGGYNVRVQDGKSVATGRSGQVYIIP